MTSSSKTFNQVLWLFILPFFGIPGVWKERLILATGLLLLGSVLYAHYKKPAPETEPPQDSTSVKKETLSTA